MMYFPDEMKTGKLPDRQYFYNTINTVYPGYLEQLILHANKQRNGQSEAKEKEQTILATNEWV